GLGTALYLRPVEERRTTKLAMLPPAGASMAFTGIPAVSPNGQRIAFVATTGMKDTLWVRELDSLAARALPGTDGASYPFWSPDSRSVGFFADGKLKKIEVAGGLAVTLCDAPGPGGASWSRAGAIVFGRRFNSPIRRVSEEGGSSSPVTKQTLG